MLDFCAAQNGRGRRGDPVQAIDEAYERMLRGDVGTVSSSTSRRSRGRRASGALGQRAAWMNVPSRSSRSASRDLVRRVHHERPVARHGLGERLPGEEEEPARRLARPGADHVAVAEDGEAGRARPGARPRRRRPRPRRRRRGRCGPAGPAARTSGARASRRRGTPARRRSPSRRPARRPPRRRRHRIVAPSGRTCSGINRAAATS